jgi:hypothetical protein
MILKLSIICGFFMLLTSKTIAQEVVAASGNYYESEQGSISWTLGETLIETFQAGELTLTQGFQQPALSVGTYVEDTNIDFQLTAFPNPTKGHVTISTDFLDAEKLEYLIYDLNGRIISNKTLDGPLTGIAFDDFHPGTYFIRLSNKGVTLKIFKIIKN